QQIIRCSTRYGEGLFRSDHTSFFQDRGTGENETGKKPWDGNKSGQFRRIPIRFGSCSGETAERKKGYPAGNGSAPEPLSDGMSCVVRTAVRDKLCEMSVERRALRDEL